MLNFTGFFFRLFVFVLPFLGTVVEQANEIAEIAQNINQPNEDTDSDSSDSSQSPVDFFDGKYKQFY